jgi:hypothetical protein
MKAAVLISLLITTPALAAPIHQFGDLALAPDGGKTATVESDDPGNLADEPHGQVVVRDQAGKIVVHYDPCAQCRYSGTAWSPKGDALVFLATDEKAAKTILFRAVASSVQPLTTIAGFANTPRFSPDGTRSHCWRRWARTRWSAPHKLRRRWWARSARMKTNSASPCCRRRAAN